MISSVMLSGTQKLRHDAAINPIKPSGRNAYYREAMPVQHYLLIDDPGISVEPPLP